MSRKKPVKDTIEVAETHSRLVRIRRGKDSIATLTKSAESPQIAVRIGSDNYTSPLGGSINLPVDIDPDVLREAIDKATEEIPHG